MKTIIFLLALAGVATAAEAPQPETTRELELRRALIDSQMQVMSMTYKQLQDEKAKVEAELAKRKPTEAKPAK